MSRSIDLQIFSAGPVGSRGRAWMSGLAISPRNRHPFSPKANLAHLSSPLARPLSVSAHPYLRSKPVMVSVSKFESAGTEVTDLNDKYGISGHVEFIEGALAIMHDAERRD